MQQGAWASAQIAHQVGSFGKGSRGWWGLLDRTGQQYLGAPRDESALGPEPCVEGAAAGGGRLDSARTASPAARRRGYPNLPGTPGRCLPVGTGPMRSPCDGTPEFRNLVSGGRAECGDKS